MVVDEFLKNLKESRDLWQSESVTGKRAKRATVANWNGGGFEGTMMTIGLLAVDLLSTGEITIGKLERDKVNV